MKKLIRRLRTKYVLAQVARAQLPIFSPDSPCRRCRIRFEGRVQKVGFRLEVRELALRLGLTGWCRNLADGAVLAEIQGPEDRIAWLRAFMKGLRRIRITAETVEELPLVPGETGFARQ